MFLGGLLATEALAERALAAGKSVCITHALESSVGRENALALAAAFSESGPHGVASRGWPIVDGHITYPLRSITGAVA